MMDRLKGNQYFLKTLLIIQALALIGYSIFAYNNEGWGLYTIFAENILDLGWNGQFNLDFMCYLLLSGLWIVWRNNYTASSILIATMAMVIGIMFFAPYVLSLLINEKGDLNKVIAGNR